ncbi:MAG: glycosyltransferase family 39 protein [Anaerolineae bacterium]
MFDNLNTNQRNLWVTVFLLLLACWLGARMLTHDLLFVDEYWSLRNSGGIFGPLGLWGIWERTATVDPGGMGVLYHWLLAGWQRLIGTSVYSVRVFSLLCGLLALAGTYHLGHTLFDRRVGLLALGLLATSALFIDYLHEARAYSLLILLAIGAVLSYWHAIQQPNWQAYLALTLTLSALAYTHYVALTMGFVLGIVHLLHAPIMTARVRWRDWWLVVLAMALGGVLFLPWLDVTLGVVSRGAGDLNRQGSSMDSVQLLVEFLQGFSNTNMGLLILFALFALLKRTRASLMLWVWVIASLCLVALINWQIPFMLHLRYVLFLFPAVVLISALGIAELARRGVPMLAVISVWGLLGILQTLNPAFINSQFGHIYRAPADGFLQARQQVLARAQDDDLVLLHIMEPDNEPLAYFVLDYYFEESRLGYDQYERMNNSFATGDNDYLLDVESVMSGREAVWSMVIPDLPSTNKSGVVDYVLSTQYVQCGRLLDHPNMQLTLFVSPSQAQQPTGTFSEQIRVYDLDRTQQTADSVHVVTGWQLNEVPLQTYSLGLHLFDANNQLVAQQDHPLPDVRPFACAHTELSIGHLAGGDYQLSAIVYNPYTGERLGEYVPLRTITID